MTGMFMSCRSLISLDVSEFNTGSVNAMFGMFRDCSSLMSLDLSGFDTSSVTDMGLMFSSCSNLETIYVKDGWSTASVTSSDNMFFYCTNLVGAVAYSSSNANDATYANYTTGYLTYKVDLPEEETILASGSSSSSAGVTFTVPAGVNILRIDDTSGGDCSAYNKSSDTFWPASSTQDVSSYVAVTPGKTYTLTTLFGSWRVVYSASINEMTPTLSDL